MTYPRGRSSSFSRLKSKNPLRKKKGKGDGSIDAETANESHRKRKTRKKAKDNDSGDIRKLGQNSKVRDDYSVEYGGQAALKPRVVRRKRADSLNNDKAWRPDIDGRERDASAESLFGVIQSVWNNVSSGKPGKKTYSIYNERPKIGTLVKRGQHPKAINQIFADRNLAQKTKKGVIKYQSLTEAATKFKKGEKLALFDDADLTKSEKSDKKFFIKNKKKYGKFFDKIHKTRNKPNHMLKSVQDKVKSGKVKVKEITDALEASFTHFINPKAKKTKNNYWRVYVSAKPEYAHKVFGYMSGEFLDKKNDVRNIKIGSPKDLATRAESIVLYANTKEEAERVANKLKEYRENNPSYFEDFSPAFTLNKAGGVSIAQSDGPTSFGHSRADLIDNVAKNFKMDPNLSNAENKRRFVNAVDDMFLKNNINIYSPHKMLDPDLAKQYLNANQKDPSNKKKKDDILAPLNNELLDKNNNINQLDLEKQINQIQANQLYQDQQAYLKKQYDEQQQKIKNRKARRAAAPYDQIEMAENREQRVKSRLRYEISRSNRNLDDAELENEVDRMYEEMNFPI